MGYKVVSKKKNQLFVGGLDRKSVPHDHRVPSLGKPRYANRLSSGLISLSHLQTHDRFLLSHRGKLTEILIWCATKAGIAGPLDRYQTAKIEKNSDVCAYK